MRSISCALARPAIQRGNEKLHYLLGGCLLQKFAHGDLAGAANGAGLGAPIALHLDAELGGLVEQQPAVGLEAGGGIGERQAGKAEAPDLAGLVEARIAEGRSKGRGAGRLQGLESRKAQGKHEARQGRREG
jgi:hypothetical protein